MRWRPERREYLIMCGSGRWASRGSVITLTSQVDQPNSFTAFSSHPTTHTPAHVCWSLWVRIGWVILLRQAGREDSREQGYQLAEILIVTRL